jgi:hypothetical protein
MTDHHQPGQPVKHTGYERTDLTERGVLIFMGLLALGTIIVSVVLIGIYGLMNKHESEVQPPMSPLVTNMPQDTRVMPGDPQEYLKKSFPEPRLEKDEGGDHHDEIVRHDDLLGSYGYVDERSGVVRIPIERAMDLIVQRGLPTRAQGSTQAPAAAEKAPGEKSEAPTKAKGKK